MKKTTALLLTLVCLGVFQAAQAQVAITTQPGSRTNNVGDNAQFSVAATGTGTLSFQWKFNTVAIDGATASTLVLPVTSSSQAGSYTVVVSDTSPSSLESSPATLSIPFANRTKLAQWNFNSAPQGNPSYGSGTYTILGVTMDNIASAVTSDPATPNNVWRGYKWGAASDPNKAMGIQLNVDTRNFKDLVITWEQKNKPGDSKYWRLQYTTNGNDWCDWTVHTITVAQAWTFQCSDLSTAPGVNNRQQFGLRWVQEWQSTATTNGTTKYVPTGAGGWYANDQVSLDLFTILGTPYTPTDEQPVIATQPQSQTVVVGDNVTFNVAAAGDNLVYYWRFGGDVISSGTSSSLTLPSVQLTNAGTYSVIVSNSAGTAISSDAVLTVLEPLPPGDRFWSADGTTAGGAGTWDNTTLRRWGLAPEGPFDLRWHSENLDNAVFMANGATPGTITVASPVTVNKITVTNASATIKYSFGGSGSITFTNDAEFYFPGSNGGSDVNSVTVNTLLSGPVVTKTGGGRLSISNTGNTVGRYVVSGGIIGATTGTQFGVAPTDVVTNYFTLDDGAGIGFAGTTTVSIGSTKGIYLRGNGKIGVAGDAGSPTTLTLSCPITGPGNLSFPDYSSFPNQLSGAGGKFILNNANNDWRGVTTVTVGELRVGVAGALPTNTSITLNGGSGANVRGRLNVNGFDVAVQNVIVNGGGAMIFDSVGTGSLTATNYDIRQSYTATNALSAVLAGNANLTKTTSGDAELRAANTYTGDTFLELGNLILTSPGRFGNGAGVLHLDGGNLLFNDTRTEETILMNPVVVTNPVEMELKSSASATGAVVFLSGGTWTVEQGTIYLVNGSTDVDSSFTLALTNAAQFGVGATVSTDDGTCFLASLNPAGTDQTFDSAINGSGGFRRSVLAGAGGRTIFNNANNYSGGTVIDAGTLLVNCTYSTSTGYGAVTVGAPGGVLGGIGMVGGPVTVNSGGSIAAGTNVGILTLQGGLDMSGGGANVWELGALKDNADGVAGSDYDQLLLTGGELVLGGSSVLVLQFAEGLAPYSTIPFWQSAHTWTIVSLSGGMNTANAAFASVANGSYNAGNFATSVDSGNIVLTFTPNAPTAPQVTLNPQSRTNIVGTTATFTVAATGSDPLTYKWYRNDGFPPTQIPGATNATCTLLNVQPSQAGDYFAVVGNTLDNASSQAATLTVVQPPKVQPPSGDGQGGVVLTWPTIPGTSYQVQYNTNLATSAWYPVTNVVATGWTISITEHPAAGGNQRFYRLLIQ